MKKLNLLLLLLGFAIILLGKFQVEKIRFNSSESEDYSETWRFAIPEELLSLNPQKVTSAAEKGLMSLIFSRLVKTEENFDLVPDILSSWTFNPSQNSYTLNIREEVLFSNQKKLDADDIIFSIHQWSKKESLDSNLLSPIIGVDEYRKGNAEKINGIKKITSEKITVFLKNKSESFILTLSNPRFFVYPDKFSGMTEKAFFSAPVGTGPYKISGDLSPPVKLKRNENYFLGTPKTKNIEIIKLRPNEALNQYQLGKINDLIFYDDFDFNTEAALLSSTDNTIRTINTYKTETIIFNAKADSRFRDSKNREKFFKLIDFEHFIPRCYHQKNRTIDIIPKGLLGSVSADQTAQEKERGLSPHEAKELSGITIYFSSRDRADCFRAVHANRLKTLNISVKSEDFNTLFKLFVQSKLAVWVETLAYKTEDPSSVLQYFSTESNEYLLGAQDSQLEKLYKKLNQTNTLEEKSSIYHEIDKYITSRRWVIPLASYPGKVIYKNKIKNIRFSGDRYFVTNWHEVGIQK